MIILAVLATATLLGVVVFVNSPEYRTAHHVGFGLGFISALLLLVALTLLPFSHFNYQSEIRQFSAVRATVAEMRRKVSVENAAMQVKIAEWNEWLARAKYYQQSVFGLWVPDEVGEMEALK